MKILYKALNMAISMFTVIPLPKYEWDENASKYIMRFYPLIGALIGCIWYLSYFILHKLNISTILMASLLIGVPYFTTGFLHLDGFMDVSDAVLSRRDRETKLKILKDSRVGAFSVISLVLLLIIEFSGMETLLKKEINMLILILIPMVSRCISGYLIISKEMIGESSLGKFFKKGTGKKDAVFLILVYSFIFLVAYFALGFKYGLVILIMGLIGMILYKKMKKELGGINGDVAGYILTLVEFTGIILLAIL